MKLRIHIAFIALLLLSTFNPQLSTVHAQGTAFTYQGRLNDGGSPAHGSYDLRFKLFLDPLGNTQAGSAVLTNGVALTNGLFTVTIDFGTGLFTGSNYWLEVDVRTNGGSSYLNLNPLQALTPTPYALFASEAGSIAGGSVTTAALADSSVSTPKLADSSVTLAKIATNQVVASLNGLKDDIALTPSGDITITVHTNTHRIEIFSSGGAGSFWSLAGNSGTVPPTNFLGTVDNNPLEFRVNNTRAFRLEPGIGGEGAPNVLGGSSANYISNGVVGATIGGGGAVNYQGLSPSNSVTGDFGTVSGGDGNRALGYEATISGGGDNAVSNDDATIGGGFFNQASGYSATIGGGFGNVASGDESTVGGGLGDTASGQYATVGGGFGNVASGQNATVPGGNGNIASGTSAFAAGQQALASHPGAFVWADSQNATCLSDRANQFKIRAGGGMVLDVSGSSGLNPAAMLINSTSANGVGLYVVETSSDAALVVNNAGAGDILKGFNGGGNPVFEVVHSGAVNATSFNPTSDRNLKEHFAAIPTTRVLDKVLALPITEWNFKMDSPQQRHLGPMAQDFHAAFGLNGDDDRHISVTDEGGVALAAIQGLNQKLTGELEQKETEITELKQRLATLEKIVLNQKSN